MLVDRASSDQTNVDAAMTRQVSLSIITVVMDDSQGFQTTVESLLRQDFDDFELVVIDSSSNTDEISQILSDSDFSDSFTAAYQWVNPGGIYSAMNQGLGLAQGEYVYFLNAGDRLDSVNVLTRVLQRLRETKAAWLFGPVIMVEPDGSWVTTPSWNYADEQRNFFARGLFPPHQGTFASLAAIKECGGFDARYSISADYALFLQLSLKAEPTVVEFPIAQFATGGVSTKKWRDSFAQFHRARVEIFQPHGKAAAREKLWTYWHFTKVWVYRELIERARR